jgi:hypothetical protein
MISPKFQKGKEAPSEAKGTSQGEAQGGAQGDTQIHHATLGCFATHTKSNCTSICALIAGHFVINFGNEIFDKDKRLLGRVIPKTGGPGYYDIAAAEIVNERVLNLDTNFRNYDGEIRRARLVEITAELQVCVNYLIIKYFCCYENIVIKRSYVYRNESVHFFNVSINKI